MKMSISRKCLHSRRHTHFYFHKTMGALFPGYKFAIMQEVAITARIPPIVEPTKLTSSW